MADRRILFNLASLATARVLWRGLSAVVLLLVARHLGVELFGVYTAAFSFAALATAFTEVGTTQVLLRSVAREGEGARETLGNAILVKGVLTVLAFGGMLLVSKAVGHDDRMFLAVLLVGAAAFATLSHQIPIVVLQGLERMHVIAFFQASAALIALGAVAGTIALDGSLYEIAGALAIANLLPLPLMMIVALKAVRPRPKMATVPTLLREGASFGILAGLYLVLPQTPIILLERYTSAAEVGLFAAAFRPVAILYVVPQVVSSVLVPRMFKHGAEDVERHRITSTRLLEYLSTTGFVISAALFVSADQVVPLLFGSEFTGTVPLLRILCWFLSLQCLSYPLGDALTTADHNRLRVIALAIAVTLLIAGNLLVIPRYGAEGAAYVTLAADGALVLLLAFLVKRIRPDFPIFRTVLPQAVAVGAGLAAAWGYLGARPPTGWLDLIVAIAILLAVSAVIVGAVRFFGRR